MLTYEYKCEGTKQQYAAIDEAIRVVQFIRNKCLRKWMDERGVGSNDLQCYCAVLAAEYPFAARLNSQARQASAEFASFLEERFSSIEDTQSLGAQSYVMLRFNQLARHMLRTTRVSHVTGQFFSSAIEICLASRRKMTELWQQQGRDPLLGFRILRIGLDPDRNALYERINQRAQNMFEHGLIQESETLLQKYGDAARPLTSLGYRQAVEFLHGDLSREQALEAAQQAHRNYAKRQMTWFRREPEVTWLNGFGSDPQIQRVATDLVKASLRPDQP